MPGKLGNKLKAVRDIKGLSLAAVAEPAGMSATYLQKLERDEVESPSPHRLYRLAQFLGLDYGDLMEAAGYVVPRREANGARETPSLMAQALSSQDVSEEEMAELADYLAFKRQQKTKRA